MTGHFSSNDYIQGYLLPRSLEAAVRNLDFTTRPMIKPSSPVADAASTTGPKHSHIHKRHEVMGDGSRAYVVTHVPGVPLTSKGTGF